MTSTKDLSDFEKGFIDEARRELQSQRLLCWLEFQREVTVLISVEKKAVKRVGNCV